VQAQEVVVQQPLRALLRVLLARRAFDAARRA